MHIAVILVLSAWAVSASADDDERDLWKKRAAFGDSVLDVKQQNDWIEIGRYYAERREQRENPQYKIAKEYFQLYLDRHPSKIASKALDYALTMWSNIDGGSYEIEKALAQVGYDEDVWDRVGRNVLDAYARDGRSDEGTVLLGELGHRIVPLKGRASVLAYLAIHWLSLGNDSQARPILVQLIEWNEPELFWPSDQIKRSLQNIDSLPVGRPAPDFSVQDINGKPVRLSDYRGKVVILYFWTTGCAPCLPYYPVLRRIVQKYPSDKVAVIGVALTAEDLPAAKAAIAAEKMTWPQIVDNWNPENRSDLPRQYRVYGVPSVAVIDGNGILLTRNVGPALALERSIRELAK